MPSDQRSEPTSRRLRERRAFRFLCWRDDRVVWCKGAAQLLGLRRFRRCISSGRLASRRENPNQMMPSGESTRFVDISLNQSIAPDMQAFENPFTQQVR